jgi:hypothetical protein
LVSYSGKAVFNPNLLHMVPETRDSFFIIASPQGSFFGDAAPWWPVIPVHVDMPAMGKTCFVTTYVYL